MAVSSKVGTFTIASSDTVGTTQQITVGFQPKVIFFWTVGHSSATDAVTNQTARVAFGAATSTTNRGSVGSISLHAAATIDGGRAYDNRYCLVVPQTNPSGLEGALDISAIDSTSFTVIVDDQFPTTLRISYLALGGADITDAVVGDYNAPVATGNADITSLAFQPDFLLMFGNSTTSATNGTSASRSFINVGAASGSSNQAVIEIGEGPEGNTTSQSRSYAYSGEIYAAMADTPTSIASRAAFVSFLSNGFRLNWLEAAAAYRVFYVAIKGGSWTVSDLLTQTDTSTPIVEGGFGFAPSATMLFSHNMAQSTQDTVQNDARLSVGAFTSTSERVAQAFLSETGAANMDISNAVEYDAAYINISTASAVQGLMDVQSVDSGGFTLIMDDADPSQSFVWYFSVGVASGGGSQTISPAGIASGEAFGVATVTPGAVVISPAGIASGEAFGIATVTPGAVVISPAGIASGEAFGSATVTPGSVVISPVGIASDEAFGVATVTPGGVVISPTGIASGEAFGVATVTPGGVVISPTGIASGEAFGVATVTPGSVVISPAGIASGEAFGSAAVTPGSVVISPAGIASGEAFGSATVTPGAVVVSPAGIASSEAVGSATVTPGAVVISPAGIASGEAFGNTTVTPGVVVISPAGIASGEAFGSLVVTVTGGSQTILPVGIASDEVFGSATVTPGAVVISPTGIASDEVFGNATVTPGVVVISPASIASGEAFGVATIALIMAIATSQRRVDKVVQNRRVDRDGGGRRVDASAPSRRVDT